MRHILSLNEAWSFRKEHQEATILDLPHTWNAADGMDGGGDYWRGKGIYEKTLTREALPQGERIFLEIPAATFTQGTDGAYTRTPGLATLVVTGTI